MKKFLCIILSIFMILGFTGCISTDSTDLNTNTSNNGSSSYKYEFIGELDMTVDYTTYLGYTTNIKGKLKNTTNREFVYVSVTFAIFDADGNQIETALDNMNYLQPGSVWNFNASMLGWTEVEPKSCKLVNVEAW